MISQARQEKRELTTRSDVQTPDSKDMVKECVTVLQHKHKGVFLARLNIKICYLLNNGRDWRNIPSKKLTIEDSKLFPTSLKSSNTLTSLAQFLEKIIKVKKSAVWWSFCSCYSSGACYSSFTEKEEGCFSPSASILSYSPGGKGDLYKELDRLDLSICRAVSTGRDLLILQSVISVQEDTC